MAPRATLILPVLVALAAAKGLNDYVPACGMPCLNDTISASTTCTADDNACLCEMKYTLKRNSEFCLQDKCDGAQYGQVMTGLDSFCRDAGSGTSPTSPAPTSEAPTAYPTAAPSTESSTTAGASSASTKEPSAYPTIVPTVVPSGSASSSGTTSIETPTATYATGSTSIATPTSTFVTGTHSESSLPSTTTTLASVGTTSQQVSTTQQAPTTPAQSQAPSSTPSQSPIAAGVQQRAGYVAVAGGLFVAAFFGL